LKLRQNGNRKRKYTDDLNGMPDPKTEHELQEYVLSRFHFCSNLRGDDPTAKTFKAKWSNLTDGSLLLFNALLLAIFPRTVAFTTLVAAACGGTGFVFNPKTIIAGTFRELRTTLSAAAEQYQQKHGFQCSIIYICCCSFCFLCVCAILYVFFT